MNGYLVHLTCPTCTATCDLDQRRPRVCHCPSCGRTWKLVYELREYRNPHHIDPAEKRRQRSEWTRRGWARLTPEQRAARTAAAREAARQAKKGP